MVTADGEWLIRKTIKELGEELGPTEFWQVHRSNIVNVPRHRPPAARRVRQHAGKIAIQTFTAG